MSTPQCTTTRLKVVSEVAYPHLSRVGALLDKLLNDGALDYLPKESTCDGLRELGILLARAGHALGGSHTQRVGPQS